MRKVTFLVITVFIMAMLVGAAAKTTLAAETAALSQGVKVIIDNERVKVTEAIRKPGEKEEMHTHPAYVAYFFEPCKIKFTFPDGKTKEKEFTAGEVMWKEGVTHAIEVLGTTNQHVLLVEIK